MSVGRWCPPGPRSTRAGRPAQPAEAAPLPDTIAAVCGRLRWLLPGMRWPTVRGTRWPCPSAAVRTAAAVSTPHPELRPPGGASGRLVSGRGHCRSLRVSAATGSGRRVGVRWVQPTVSLQVVAAWATRLPVVALARFRISESERRCARHTSPRCDESLTPSYVRLERREARSSVQRRGLALPLALLAKSLTLKHRFPTQLRVSSSASAQDHRYREVRPSQQSSGTQQEP